MSATPPCIITYYYGNRAFQRVFAESDIEGMKQVVRKKLNFTPGTQLNLAQLADGDRVDLEDGDDFSAFKSGTSTKPEMYVEVSISAASAAQLASPNIITLQSFYLDQ
ncbi:hypothetical protein FRC12_016540, partial [Ceratobasidium sp. 428]